MKLTVIPKSYYKRCCFYLWFLWKCTVEWSVEVQGWAVCQYKCEKRFNKGNMNEIRCCRNCFPACYILCFICLLLHNRELFIHE